jgi:hypothetical protein
MQCSAMQCGSVLSHVESTRQPAHTIWLVSQTSDPRQSAVDVHGSSHAFVTWLHFESFRPAQSLSPTHSTHAREARSQRCAPAVLQSMSDAQPPSPDESGWLIADISLVAAASTGFGPKRSMLPVPHADSENAKTKVEPRLRESIDGMHAAREERSTKRVTAMRPGQEARAVIVRGPEVSDSFGVAPASRASPIGGLVSTRCADEFGGARLAASSTTRLLPWLASAPGPPGGPYAVKSLDCCSLGFDLGKGRPRKLPCSLDDPGE